MVDFNVKGHFQQVGKTFRLNIEGIEYFVLLSDVFQILCGEHNEKSVFLHNALGQTESETDKPKK
jgi:hypothetical protein